MVTRFSAVRGAGLGAGLPASCLPLLVRCAGHEIVAYGATCSECNAVDFRGDCLLPTSADGDDDPMTCAACALKHARNDGTPMS